jgi:hypothetical protein
LAQRAEPLTAYELAQITRRIDAATPYPWYEDPERGLVNSDGKVIARVGAGFTLDAQDEANARFIADARYDVPALMATLAQERRDHAELCALAALIEDGTPKAADWSLSQLIVPFALVEKARALLGTR